MQQTIENATDDLSASAQEPLDVPGHRSDAKLHLARLQSVIRFASLATTLLTVGLPIYSSNFGASGLERDCFSLFRHS